MSLMLENENNIFEGHVGKIDIVKRCATQQIFVI